MSLNSIFLRRRTKVVLQGRGQKTPAPFLATINANIEPLGYTLSPNLIQAITKAGQSTAVEFHDELVVTLKEMKGVKDYQPTYPNFPQQVMEASEAELYLNAIVQYFHDWIADIVGDPTISWKPHYDKKARPNLQDEVKLTVVDLGTEAEFEKLMAGLMATNTSVSQQDKDDIRWFLDHGGFDHLPLKIPHKEMLALIGGVAIAKGIDLSNYFKTATDVLRLATALSDGDVSLAEPTKFKSFPRKERKALLGLLNDCREITEDMLLHKGKWIKLGERLHPGEFKLTKVSEAFDVLRNNKPFQTFNSKVEAAIKTNDAKKAFDLLATRPGMLARRLDQLIRLDNPAGWPDMVIKFDEVALEVSTPVLLQAMNHFANRRDKSDLRVFFPKGNVAKAQAIRNELSSIPSVACKEIVGICKTTLIERFSKMSPLGRCKIDKTLKECLVPFSQRSASRSLKTIVRGSKLPFGAGGDTIRFFIWWKQKENDRTDLDLSAAFFGEDWQYKTAIAYYNLKEGQCCHSGDQTSAPEGACEFIDVDIPWGLSQGRYVVMSVNSYTHQKFADLPECSAGWMIRQHPKSGEIFEPKTVENKLDVASPSTAVIPMILDLQERKVIWADAAMKINTFHPNNVHCNLSTIGLFGKAFSELKKPNLYDLFALHVEARGELVTRGKADKVFGLEDAFAIEKIMSEFMR